MSTEQPAAPAAPEAVPAPTAPAPEKTAPSVAEATPPEQQPEKTFSQKELDDILERRLAKERRKRKEIEDRLRITEELAIKKRDAEQAPTVPTSNEPKREQFGSYEEFLEARADWRAEQKVDKKFKEREENESRTRTEEKRKKNAEGFIKRAKESGIEDFEEVMSTSEAIVTDEMSHAIMVSEDGPKVAYHLARNPGEAERIANLPADVQAREVWKLEQKLGSAPAPKKPSSAPAPIKPGGAASAPGDENPSDKDSIADWMKKEEARARKKQGLSA